MPRTLSDEEYSHLLGRKQVADFVEPIYNDPRFGKEARALIKRAYPNLQIEGYDLEQKMEARFDQEKKEREDAERKKNEAADAEKFKDLRKKVQDQYKFTDEGMKQLEDLMIERNIGDYEAGALLKASKDPRPAEPTSGSQRFWNFEKRDEFSEISKDPEKWGFNQLLGAAERDAARARNGEF
jgi:hypothetical protein